MGKLSVAGGGWPLSSKVGWFLSSAVMRVHRWERQLSQETLRHWRQLVSRLQRLTALLSSLLCGTYLW